MKYQDFVNRKIAAAAVAQREREAIAQSAHDKFNAERDLRIKTEAERQAIADALRAQQSLAARLLAASASAFSLNARIAERERASRSAAIAEAIDAFASFGINNGDQIVALIENGDIPRVSLDVYGRS